MGATAIVTGVPGWLGTRFLDALVDGLPDCPELLTVSRASIRVLTLPEQANQLGSKYSEIEKTEGDVRDVRSLEKLFSAAKDATVFHIAGVIHPTKSTREFVEINVDGTRNMLELAAKSGARRFVHVSSNSPCGCNHSNNDRFDERSPYNPYMGYGRSKKLAEDLVNQKHQNGQLETVIVRPPWFYGVGQPPRQTLFFSMVKSGKVPIVGSGQNFRSMAYVDNICQGLLLSEQVTNANGQTYWIADETPYSMNTIVDTIEDVLEKDFKIEVSHKRMHLPDLASEIALVIDSLMQGTGLYNQKIHVLSEMNKTIACSIEKAKRELSYKPKVALREGMRRSIQYVLDRGESI